MTHLLKTELERVESATPEQREFVAKRLLETDWIHSGNEEEAGVCFFCGKSVKHVNVGGDGWFFNVKTSDGSFKTAMYCNETCGDNPLMWRESLDLGSYVEVIGESGPLGLTPATTKWFDFADAGNQDIHYHIRKIAEESVGKPVAEMSQEELDEVWVELRDDGLECSLVGRLDMEDQSVFYMVENDGNCESCDRSFDQARKDYFALMQKKLIAVWEQAVEKNPNDLTIYEMTGGYLEHHKDNALEMLDHLVMPELSKQHETVKCYWNQVYNVVRVVLMQ